MKKVRQQTEQIFAHAVALGQSGRLRSTIYAIGAHIYVLGSDHTTLMRFGLPGGQVEFDAPVAFRSNDYDSPTFGVENGRVIFVQEGGGFERKKLSAVPDFSPEDIQGLFDNTKVVKKNSFTLSSGIVPLLDENLSHVEISAEDGELLLVQRNVYDGTVSELRRAEDGASLGVGNPDEIKTDFGPFGIRTDSLLAVFAFNDVVKFYCGSKIPNVLYAVGERFDMRVLISGCVYDELGTTSVIDLETKKPKEKKSASGRKIKKRRRTK